MIPHEGHLALSPSHLEMHYCLYCLCALIGVREGVAGGGIGNLSIRATTVW
jgi:hypothetical protein